MHTQNNTVPVSTGRVHKHTETYARRIVRTMTSEKTPDATRRKLREALRSLFAYTDIDKRRSLSKVENVAAVLGCTGLYYLNKKYVEAREARKALCRVMEDYDRQARPWPYPWLKREKRPARSEVVKAAPARGLVGRAGCRINLVGAAKKGREDEFPPPFNTRRSSSDHSRLGGRKD